MDRRASTPHLDKTDTPEVPTVSTLSRIGAVDFLAVLPSGIFTFLVTYMVLSGNALSESNSTLWQGMQQMVADSLDNPLVLLSVLFVSYFFGSVLRAFPVEWVVSSLYIGRRRFRRGKNNRPRVDRREKPLPSFGKLLPTNIRALDVIPKAIVNNWKQTLSRRSPEAYAYFRTVEARSRFAAAMLWAGLVGIAGSVYYMAAVGSNAAVSQLALVSVLLALVSGSQLPKVCKQEVSTLLTLSEVTSRSSQS